MPKRPKAPKVPQPITSIFTVEESWDWLIRMFVYARWHEGTANVARIKKIMKVLHAEAEAARDDADLMDRGQEPVRPSLRERFDRAGLTGDPVAEWDYKVIATPSLMWQMNDPGSVRRYGAFIKGMPISIHESTLEANSKIKQGRKGRPLSEAMDSLLHDAGRMNASDTMLARKLAEAGLKPEGPGSDEVDLAVRWLDVIKAARYRARRRGKVTK